MDVTRSTTLVGTLLAVGFVLLALPIAVPADVPDNRVEFYVEADWSDYAGQTNLASANLSESARTVFETARRATPETINRSVATAPESVTPPPDRIDVYNVRDGGVWYLLQVRHLTDEADFVTQHLPRLGSMAVGFVFLVGAAYWRFEACRPGAL